MEIESTMKYIFNLLTNFSDDFPVYGEPGKGFVPASSLTGTFYFKQFFCSGLKSIFHPTFSLAT